MTIETISQEAYEALKPLVDANQAAMRNGPNPRDPETHPYPFPHIGNKEAGAIEQYELRRDKPHRFTAYLSSDGKSVTVWTGDQLGFVLGRVNRWRTGGFARGEMAAGQFMMRGSVYSFRGPGAGMHCRCRKLKGRG